MCNPVCVRSARPAAIKGLAHITGGGFTDNIPRVLPKHLGVAHRPRAAAGAAGVQMAGAQGGIAELEMLRTFNCGIGMIAVVEPDEVDAVTMYWPRAARASAFSAR